jgi:hypothetical protein
MSLMLVLKAETMTHLVGNNILEAVIAKLKLALCFSGVLALQNYVQREYLRCTLTAHVSTPL